MGAVTPTLNFGALPSLETCSLFMSISPDLARSIEPFEQLFQRVTVCTRFAWYSSADRKHLGVPEPEELPLREGFIRASLAEFAELENAAKRDLRKLDRSVAGIEFRQTTCPLIHALRALRNVAIHVEPGGLSVTTTNAKVSFQGEVTDVEAQCWLLSKVTVGQLNDPQQMKTYTPEQRAKMFSWFYDGQSKWGVQELIRLGVQGYVEHFIEKTVS